MAELTENLIRLRTAPGVGNAILWRLLRHFGNADAVLGATTEGLMAVKGVSAEIARRILEAATHDPRTEMEKAVRAGVEIIPYDDPAYPKPLLHSYDPPAVLYVRGRLLPEDGVAVGIVGTRRASSYGRDNALGFAAALARAGYTVVSGLARGVDTFSHIGALNARGRTVGVLGCGFDHMYPEENRDLALEMTMNGAVITEFPMATPPSRDTFPTRNRIIAGMVLGLLVIEAPLRSGSLITARLANEIGRTVFAVPGRVDDPRSEGCNRLIRDGATMVMTVDDILRDLNPSADLPPPPGPRGRRADTGSLFAAKRGSDPTRENAPTPEPESGGRDKEKSEESGQAMPANPVPTPRLNDAERQVLDSLLREWRTIDDVTAICGLESGIVSATLAMLRLKRLVEQGPGQTYRLR